jgi:hypothetical protein
MPFDRSLCFCERRRKRASCQIATCHRSSQPGCDPKLRHSGWCADLSRRLRSGWSADRPRRPSCPRQSSRVTWRKADVRPLVIRNSYKRSPGLIRKGIKWSQSRLISEAQRGISGNCRSGAMEPAQNPFRPRCEVIKDFLPLGVEVLTPRQWYARSRFRIYLCYAHQIVPSIRSLCSVFENSDCVAIVI